MANQQRPAPDPATPTPDRNTPTTDPDDGTSKPRPGQGEHPNPGKWSVETIPNELLPGD